MQKYSKISAPNIFYNEIVEMVLSKTCISFPTLEPSIQERLSGTEEKPNNEGHRTEEFILHTTSALDVRELNPVYNL